MATPKPTWTSVKPAVTALDRNGLIGLIKDLFETSAENRSFLVARFKADEDPDLAVEAYRRKIVEQFYPKRGYGDPKLSVCRKQISDYRKARGDLAGLAELMLVFIESGVQFSADFSWYDENLVCSLASMAGTLVNLLGTDEGMPVYAKLQDRFEEVIKTANRIGGGYLVADEFHSMRIQLIDWQEERSAADEPKKPEPDF